MNAMVRKAQMEDIPAIQQVAKESWHDTYRELIPEPVQDQFLSQAYSNESMLKRIEQMVCFVAEIDNKVIGFANASKKGDKAYLHAIYLLPAVKGNGIGTKLLNTLLEEFTDISELHVEVEKGNVSGEAFYQARGFAMAAEYEDDLFGHALKTKQMVLSV